MVKDQYAQSRRMYIYEAAFEYLIDILVGTTYLAKIASSLGMTSSEIGILSSFVSLAEAFMLAALLLVRKTPVKRWIIPLSITNQIAFATLYFIPLISGENRSAAWFFAFLLLAGQIIACINRPAKQNWLMSLVPDNERGVFSANKEIVSLLSGMAFTAGMSALIDRFESKGELKKAFIFIGITIFALMILHTLTLIFAKEKEMPKTDTPNDHIIRRLITDRKFLIVLGVSLIWSVTNNIARPFFGSYEIDELGFSMTFASAITIVGSFVRVLFSRPMGRFGDKKGFITMLSVGFATELCSLITASLSTPGNGKIMFTASMILHYISMAGINSGLMNLIFDHVHPAERTAAIAVRDSLAGLLGFGVTVAVSNVVTAIQNNGNTIFGHTIYAQQLLSIFAVVGCTLILVYIFSVKKYLSRR